MGAMFSELAAGSCVRVVCREDDAVGCLTSSCSLPRSYQHRRAERAWGCYPHLARVQMFSIHVHGQVLVAAVGLYEKGGIDECNDCRTCRPRPRGGGCPLSVCTKRAARAGRLDGLRELFEMLHRPCGITDGSGRAQAGLFAFYIIGSCWLSKSRRIAQI